MTHKTHRSYKTIPYLHGKELSGTYIILVRWQKEPSSVYTDNLQKEAWQFTTAQQNFNEWDTLNEIINKNELRLALSEATECFKSQQQLDESYLETYQQVQYKIDVDLSQDKHKVNQKKLFEMEKAIDKIELEIVAENVIGNTFFGDATLHQMQVAKPPKVQLLKIDGNFSNRKAFIVQFDTAVHLNTKYQTASDMSI